MKDARTLVLLLRVKFMKDVGTSVLLLIDPLVATVGLILIWIGTLQRSTSSATTSIWTIGGGAALGIAFFGLLLCERIRRGWVGIGVVLFMLTGVLAFIQPAISQGKWTLTPTPSPTPMGYIASNEMFVLPVNKIASDLSQLTKGEEVAIVLIVGGQTYHYPATFSSVTGDGGTPIPALYANGKFAFIELVLASPSPSILDVFLSQLACATTIYLFPANATPTPSSGTTTTITPPTSTTQVSPVPSTPVPCPTS
jgi:hypothetical protein